MSAAVDFSRPRQASPFWGNDSERSARAIPRSCEAKSVSWDLRSAGARRRGISLSCEALTSVGDVAIDLCRRSLMGTQTHGHTNGRTTTPEYRAWRSMVARCTIPSASHYAEYGGRGVRVCDEWRRSFLAFFGHVGARPSPHHSLGRKDNEGHYEPGNVTWETREEQHRNQRSNRFLVIDGERMCVTDWAKRSPVSVGAITRRLDAGWDANSAVFAPSQNHGQRPLRSAPAYKPWVCVECNELILGRKRANSGRCDECKGLAS